MKKLLATFLVSSLLSLNITPVLAMDNMCPSRLKDLKFKTSTSECIFNRTNLRIANRLFMQCYQNINPLMENYFKGGI